jgi:hypothetical protein
MKIIPVGERGGVWDHVRAYAEARWNRTLDARKQRSQVFGDKKKFKKHCKTYSSSLMTSLICTTKCSVCQKVGQHLQSLAACPIETHMRGDTLSAAVMAAIAGIPANGYLVCGGGCRGNALKTYKPKLTQLARLLVVVTRGLAVRYQPMVEMDLGEQHGKYRLTGIGQCDDTHWECTFMVNTMWYHYDDMAPSTNVTRVDGPTYKKRGFDNAIHFYTKL